MSRFANEYRAAQYVRFVSSYCRVWCDPTRRRISTKIRSEERLLLSDSQQERSKRVISAGLCDPSCHSFRYRESKGMSEYEQGYRDGAADAANLKRIEHRISAFGAIRRAAAEARRLDCTCGCHGDSYAIYIRRAIRAAIGSPKA